MVNTPITGTFNRVLLFLIVLGFSATLFGQTDTIHYPIKDREGDFYTDPSDNPFNLKDPEVIDQKVEYDPVSGDFIILEKIGDRYYRTPFTMSFEEFMAREYDRSKSNYWQQRAEGANLLSRSSGIKLGGENEALDRLFGGSTVDIRPKGNVELIFGGSFQNIKNPTLPEDARKQGNFDFDMNININVLGKIGDKLKLTTNFNNNATFDYENQIKLEYTGTEDEILQSVEAGNVSFPLSNSLITGSQSLFGLKTQWKFGRLTYSNVLSQQKSNKENLTIEGGAQTKQFSIEADQYDENRHFFLSHFFRENYEAWLSNIPIINSPLNITSIEVWVTNTTGITENTRDIVGFMDLGESRRSYREPGAQMVPQNVVGNLYKDLLNNADSRKLDRAISTLQSPPLNLVSIRDFEVTRARKLTSSEYTLYPNLGFISLNQTMRPDEVLAVSFEFTYNGQTYQVGELSQNVPDDVDNSTVLFLKMLKSTSVRPNLPIWDLMMKNIYSLGAYQISAEDFRLDILYRDPGGAKKRYLPKGEGINGVPLLKLVRLDRLNRNNDPQPDGLFDFIPGLTINPNNGKVIFPVLEPFGDYLRQQFLSFEQELADKFVYDVLYDSTKTIAEQFPEFNRYSLEGKYKSSSSSEIYLGAFNLPKGSVNVTAGGKILRENVDYTIDYNLGRVKIINDGILNSGAPINISFENSALFGFQTKSLIGNRFDYWINDDFTLGATHMSLYERPVTQKINVGDDPISNNIYGLDVNYNTKLPGLTRAIDRLPILNTKEMSSFSLTAEGAYFKPGHSKAINGEDDNEGLVYIDDFEGSKSSYDLKFPITAWTLASTPQGASDGIRDDLFPEARLFDSLPYGYNRAHLVWYNIDPVFFKETGSSIPDDIKNNPALVSNPYVFLFNEQHIFPNRDNANELETWLATFDLKFNPRKKGPYNFEYEENGTEVSAGLDRNGQLKDPQSRWGGIMRSLQTNDFEAANIEFIEFWVLDPFIDKPATEGGELFFNLGSISEDVLKDSKKFFEHGLPKPGASQEGIDETNWGRVPTLQSITNTFDNDPDVLLAQDLGYDGLDDQQESEKHQEYIQGLQSRLNGGTLDANAYNDLLNDPSKDNFKDYLHPDWDGSQLPVLDRYEFFSGSEGNTAANVDSEQFSHGSNIPDSEDLNRDNTLNQTEEYFQYRVPVYSGMNAANNPYITDEQKSTITLEDNTSREVTFYHFKIPIHNYDKKVGGIQDFKSIRFLRMFLAGFDEQVVMRFAKLELVRNQWRRYKYDLAEPGEFIVDDQPDNTFFNVSSVSLEENSSKVPIGYVIPPGVKREEFLSGGSSRVTQQNEQSLSLQVCNLKDGDSKAVYKSLNFDFRKYKRIEMFVHAEALDMSGQAPVQDDELNVFLRLGADFKENYYEYSLPLKITDPNTLGGGSVGNEELIWPSANKINLLLDSLIIVKRERNQNFADATKPFTVEFPNGHKVTILGNPDIGNVRIAMIGIKNPKDSDLIGRELCAEIWVNELRLKGIDESGGYAGLVRTDVKLADLGTFTAAGNFHTVGYGQLEQKIDERSKEDFYQYDLSTNLELGKFLPEKSNIRIPVYAQYTNSYSRPEFDPYDYDVKLKDKLEDLQDTISRKDYLNEVQDFNSLRTLNFTNVRKERGSGKKKAHLWDIENVDLSYSFTQKLNRNPTIASDMEKVHRGGLGYNYSIRPNYIEPFRKLINPRWRWLRPIKDFNFNLIPSKLAFRADLRRKYGELTLRDIYGDANIETSYAKDFSFDRLYDVKFDLTKSIKFEFSANNKAKIDEPDGPIDSPEKKSKVWDNLLSFGRNTNYNHNLSLSYNLPLNKIPLLNWVNVRTAYGGTYDWLAGPITPYQRETLLQDKDYDESFDSLNYYHVISNKRDIRINTDFNMDNLYNKVPLIRDIKRGNLRKKPIKKKLQMPKEDTKDGESEIESKMPDEEKKEKSNKSDWALRAFVDLITGLKRVSINYTISNGTTVPGFKPTTNYLGMRDFNAPGWGFITGLEQPDQSWLESAADRDWMTANDLNAQFMQAHSENMDIKVNLEPIKNLRVDLNFKKSFTENFNEIFKDTTGAPLNGMDPSFAHLNPQSSGSFSMSYLALGTRKDPIDDITQLSQNFKRFEELRQSKSQLLGANNENSQGSFENKIGQDIIKRPEYAEGYGPYSQDVLIMSFIEAYGGRKFDGTTEDLFSKKIYEKLPFPNWRVSYNGLSKVEALKSVFTNVNINHGYNSTLSVGSFASNFNYEAGIDNNDPMRIDTLSGNYFSRFNVPQVTMTEQFAPLIGVDMRLRNSMTVKVEYKTSRNVGLSLVDYQVIETRSKEITVGAGYKIKGLDLPIKWGGRKVKLDNDLNIKVDVSFRDDRTTNYKIEQGSGQTTRGNKMITISPSIDYVVNNRLTLRVFFDRRSSVPYVTSSYPTTLTKAGIALNFSLAD